MTCQTNLQVRSSPGARHSDNAYGYPSRRPGAERQHSSVGRERWKDVPAPVLPGPTASRTSAPHTMRAGRPTLVSAVGSLLQGAP